MYLPADTLFGDRQTMKFTEVCRPAAGCTNLLLHGGNRLLCYVMINEIRFQHDCNIMLKRVQ